MYAFVWYAQTGDDMVKNGIKIPPGILTTFKVLRVMVFVVILPAVIVYAFENSFTGIFWHLLTQVFLPISGLVIIAMFLTKPFLLWKFADYVPAMTGTKSAGLYFLLLLFLPGIGEAIIQNDFNKYKG